MPLSIIKSAANVPPVSIMSSTYYISAFNVTNQFHGVIMFASFSV
jgi:hypothetical protein